MNICMYACVYTCVYVCILEKYREREYLKQTLRPAHEPDTGFNLTTLGS